MRIDRRDVLKAAAATVAVGAANAWAACARGAVVNSRLSLAKGGEPVMDSQLLMTVRIVAAPSQKLGAVPQGIRSFVPVAGGDFEGPRLRGRVVPGGGDWLLLRPDGVLELDLRITLETDDGALIDMRFLGLRHDPQDVTAALGRGETVDPASYYFRTVPRYETSTEKYAFLNRTIAIGEGEARPDGAVHKIDEIL